MGIRTLGWSDTGKLDDKARIAIMAFQKKDGIEVDGYWGDYTTLRLGRANGYLPESEGGVYYGEPVRFSRPENVRVFDPVKSLAGHANSFTGGFSNQRTGLPISIMINQGDVIRDNACHSLWSFPETVFYCTKDLELKYARVLTYTQIPDYENILWAVGGLGAINYDPEAEGFCQFEAINTWNGNMDAKNFGDVKRSTWHSVYGYDQYGYVFGAIMKGTPKEIIKHCEENLALTPIIIGDGGSWAGANTDDHMQNIHHVQHSAVQMG